MQLARLVAAATASLALAACYRDRPSGGTLENRAEKARPAAPGDELAFLPLDSELVIGVDARQIFASPLWRHAEPRIMQRLGGGAQELRAACGYDPVTELRSVTVGAKLADPVEGVFVVRGLPRDKTMACLRGALAQQAGITVDGEIVLIPGDGGGTPAAMAFAGPTTLVIATSRQKLHVALSSGAPLLRSRAFAELWRLVDAGHALWAIVNGSSRAFADLSSLGIRPRAMLGSIALADGLSLTGRLRLGTPDEATQLASSGQGQLAGVRPMVDRIELGADGVDVTLRVEMTRPQVESLARLLLAMVGSFSP